MKINDILTETLDLNSSIVVYHGSSNSFDSFDMNKIGTNSNSLKGGWGIYFSTSEDIATQYTPEGKPIVKKFMLKSGTYFDFDRVMDDQTFEELINDLSYYNEKAHENAESFIEEVREYGGTYEYDLTGKNFYDILSHDLGGSKEMSMFLQHCGYKGTTFVDKTDSSVRNFVVFDPTSIKRID